MLSLLLLEKVGGGRYIGDDIEPIAAKGEWR